MNNQHTKIKGYDPQEEIDLMNEIKEVSAQVGDLIVKLESISHLAVGTNLDLIPDSRWLSTAKTELQVGFMSLVRSIAKPTSF